MAVVIEIPLPGGAGICLNMPDWIVVLIFIMIFRVWGWPMVVRRWPMVVRRWPLAFTWPWHEDDFAF
ncbi:hypothetical protein FPRO03_03861 [Fusarium proliferatum]|nr:hypothetical protein FPRO03_03861 [Fusarium proliferatum]